MTHFMKDNYNQWREQKLNPTLKQAPERQEDNNTKQGWFMQFMLFQANASLSQKSLSTLLVSIGFRDFSSLRVSK